MVLFLASALPIRLRSGSWNVCVSAVLWWGVTVLSYAPAPALSPPCREAHRHCCCICSTHRRWNQGRISGLYLPCRIICNLVLTGSRPTVTEALCGLVDLFQPVLIVACIGQLSTHWCDVLVWIVVILILFVLKWIQQPLTLFTYQKKVPAYRCNSAGFWLASS